MNKGLRLMIPAVARYEGTVARLMGDGLLALFGAPVAQEDHAERAVLAALTIRSAAADYARELAPRYGTEFAVRVGVNSGLAVVTKVGNETKAEYTPMGDAANLATPAEPGTAPGCPHRPGDVRAHEARLRGAPTGQRGHPRAARERGDVRGAGPADSGRRPPPGRAARHAVRGATGRDGRAEGRRAGGPRGPAGPRAPGGRSGPWQIAPAGRAARA